MVLLSCALNFVSFQFCAHLERDVHGDFSHPERASVDGVRTQTLLLQNDCGVVHDRAVAVLHS